MAFNMERHEDEQVNMDPLGTAFEKLANDSIEAVVGDLNTMEDESHNHMLDAIDNRTMSTGAETPFSFVFSEGFDLGTHLMI